MKKIFAICALLCVSLLVYTQNLVNPNATAEARKLKAFLDSIYGKKIISGQAFESVTETWLKRISDASGGKQPAILSLDFMNSTPWRVAHGTDPDTTTGMAIDWAKNKGGIVEMHWHWDAPKNTNFETWQGFYTKNTTFDLSYAMNDTTSEEYSLLIRDIDIIAQRLLRLQNAGVAILWRPLHEAEGKWFWWGAKGGDACKKLYRLMYNRLVNYHHINNLIWVWNSYGTTKENWYPGDDVVDIIAWDYPDYNQTTGSWSQYQTLFGDKGKLFAIGEDGKLFNPDLLEKQHWLYFITWAYMINDPSMTNGKNTADWINTVYNDSRVLTLDDLQKGLKVKAGKDQLIFDYDGDGKEMVHLDGSKSYTDSGTIVKYEWKINDSLIAEGVSPDVELKIGKYVIVLTATTDLGESKSASVRITVKIPSLTLNKTFKVSSTEAGLGNVGSNAIDGDPATRWSSVYSDPQWYMVDLAKVYDIRQVIISWETASAKDYLVQESNDGENWVTVYRLTNMKPGPRIDTISNLPGGARYIRMYGTKRNTQWGYSIYEFEVYGNENPDAVPVAIENNITSPQDNRYVAIAPTMAAKGEYIHIYSNSIRGLKKVEIFNINGTLIKRFDNINLPYEINIDNGFATGMYFIKLSLPAKNVFQKLIVR